MKKTLEQKDAKRARERARYENRREQAAETWQTQQQERDAQQVRVREACQRAWDESGDALVTVTFLPSEYGNGYAACIRSSDRNWRRNYRDLRGIARLKDVIGARARRDKFANEVIAFFQGNGVRFTDRENPLVNLALVPAGFWNSHRGGIRA